MQMWANPPVRFDPSRFRGFIADYRAIDPTPDPGDPPFFVRFEFLGEPLAIGSIVTVFRGAEAVGRGIVGDDGTVNVVPDVPISEQESSRCRSRRTARSLRRRRSRIRRATPP